MLDQFERARDEWLARRLAALDPGRTGHAAAGRRDPAAGRSRLSRTRATGSAAVTSSMTRTTRGGAPRVRAKLSTMFQSLQVRNYRLFATGQLVKLIGVVDDVHRPGLAGPRALRQLAPPRSAWSPPCQFTPVLLLTLLSGRLADRYDKRMLLFVANALLEPAGARHRACWSLTGLVQLWHVFVFAALLGIANAVETPVRQSFVSELVGTPLLPNALSLSAATFNSARIVGPAAGRPGHRRVRRRPGLPARRRQLASRRWSAWSGCAPAELHRDALPPRDERASARVIDGLRYVWQRPDLLLPMALMSRDRHDRCSTSRSPWPRWPRPSSTPAPPPSACSPPRWRSARSAGRWPAPAGASRPSVWLVLGAAIACARLRHPGRPRAGVLAGRGRCWCRPASSWSSSPRPPTSGSSWASTRPSGAG